MNGGRRDPALEEIRKLRDGELGAMKEQITDLSKRIENKLDSIEGKLDQSITCLAVHEEKFKTVDLRFTNANKDIGDLRKDFAAQGLAAYSALVGFLLALIGFVLNTILHISI